MSETGKNIINAKFPKREKLTSKKTIEELFKKGSSAHSYPFLLKYTENSEGACHQVLISVSKRNFKRAVDRNLLKRRIREAYRLNKYRIADSELFLNIAIIYIGKEIRNFQEIESKLIKLIKRLPVNKN